MSVELRDFTGYDATEIEKLVLSFWEENEIPKKLSLQRKDAKKFFLLDGPPYVNALPHVGHVKTTSCKDIWSRFKQMRGYDCVLQPGFDCHGLPVEVIVEKDLKIERKSQITEMGVDKFMRECLKKILNNEKAWMGYYKRLGAWRAYFEPYFTYKPYYIESAWWTFKQLYEKGFVVQGPRSIHWCPHCETALSGYEVSDSYKGVADPSIFIKFPLAGKEGKENSEKPGETHEFLLVWTTTPWTLPANVAIAVAPKEKYLKVKSINPDTGKEEIFIVAEKLVQKVFKMVERKYEVIASVLGKELEGLRYNSVIDCEAQRELNYNERARRVYLSISVMAKKKYKKHMKGKGAEVEEEFEEFVTMADGTGLVHCAPGHGQTDNLFGKHYNLPVVSPVNEQGLFTDEVEQWKGKFVKSAGTDKLVTDYLQERGELFHASKIVHSYPLCWRCKTPLIFRVSEQIFLTVEPIKAKMLHENNYTDWMPEYGQEAFGNWIAQANDWCVSQQRFWGIPIPLWKCASCGSSKVIGSVKELKESAAKKHFEKGPSFVDFDNLQDLHRGTVDAIELKCEQCAGAASAADEKGATMKRTQDIFNVWVDSGIAPWASLGYPFHNKELFEKVFPVDLVNESQDQVRGWFYALQFMSAATFGKPAFKGVAMMGWVVDEKGMKMSKSLGNVVTADEAIEKIGADALRLYYCWDIAPWDTQKFSFTNALEARRSLGILFNSLKFHEMYSTQENRPSVSEAGLKQLPLSIEDKWILSRLNTVAGEVAEKMERFEFHHAGKVVASFVVDDLSRWYIKLARERVSPDAPASERESCLAVLKHVLVEGSKLLAPITPFVSEYVYQKLAVKANAAASKPSQSVHLQNYPVKNGLFVDSVLEGHMRTAMAITKAANALRQENKLKLRWPLKRIIVAGDGKTGECVQALNELLKSQNNVQAAGYCAWESRQKLEASELLKEKQVLLEGGESISVLLDLARDQTLEKEALLRELLRAIQASRKQNGLVVQEKIALSMCAGEAKLAKFLVERSSEVCREVGAAQASVVGSEERLQGEFSASAEIEGVGKVLAKYSRK